MNGYGNYDHWVSVHVKDCSTISRNMPINPQKYHDTMGITN